MMTQKQKELAELAAQADKLQDEITLGNINGDAIRWCIERLNRANLYTGDSVLHKIELANAISEVIEEIWELDLKEYQKEMLFNVGGDLTLKPIADTQKLNAFDAVPVEDSEKHLKKLIKHAKTPMERKAYEKQLNALYKKKKRKI